jgi:hypothetical protein
MHDTATLAAIPARVRSSSRSSGSSLEPIRRLFLVYATPSACLGTVVALVALDGKLNIRAVVGVVLLATAAIRLLPGIRAALARVIRHRVAAFLAVVGVIHSNLRSRTPYRHRQRRLRPRQRCDAEAHRVRLRRHGSDPTRDTPCDEVRFQLELENPAFLAPRRGRDVHGARSPCLRRDAGDALPVGPDGSHRQLRNGSDDFVMSPSLRSSGRADDAVSGT